jgi:hypothetical protein
VDPRDFRSQGFAESQSYYVVEQRIPVFMVGAKPSALKNVVPIVAIFLARLSGSSWGSMAPHSAKIMN